MPITGMNHAVLYVRDASRHEAFYQEVLGFETMITHPDSAYVFMRAPGSENHHDVAFFSIGDGAGKAEAGASTVGMYHLAWEVPSLNELAAMKERLETAGVLRGASNHGVNKSLYAVDPDGLEFEVMWLVPPDRWGDAAHAAVIEPLDLVADKVEFADLSQT